MRNVHIPKGELTEEQATLIITAGKEHGVDARNIEGDIYIPNLTSTQFAQLALGFEEHWGIPFNSVRCTPFSLACLPTTRLCWRID